MRRLIKFIFAGAVIRSLLVVIVLAGMLVRVDFLSTFDSYIYDHLVSFRPVHSSEKVVVVAIDEPSIEQIGSWPWPRAYLAELLTLLSQHEPSAVGLHILFPAKELNPGLVTIRNLHNTLTIDSASISEQTLMEIETSIDGDVQLRHAINSSGRVVVPSLFLPESTSSRKLKVETSSGFNWEPLALDWRQSLSTLHNPLRNWSDPNNNKGILSSFLSPGTSTLYEGHVNYLTDPSGRARQVQLLKPLNNRLYPAFALQLTALAALSELADATKNPTIYQENGELRVNGDFVATGDDFVVYSNPTLEKTIPQYAFIDVMNGNIPRAVFKDKIVLIGLTVSSLTDGGTIVVSDPPPVISTAAMVSSLLSGSQIIRPYWAFLLEVAVLLYLSIFLILVLPRLPLGLGWLLQVFFLASWAGAVVSLLVFKGMWFQFAPHAILVVVGLLFITIQRLLARNGHNFEDLKLLGLSFQSQGMLDLAFEKFSQCPVSDKSVQEILYNLGLDFERKRMFNKASAVYTHLLTGGKFKDAKTKIAELHEMGKTVVFGGNGSNDATMILSKGTTTPTLGRYEIVSELGQGAMGTVYLGRDPKINREVAIKTLTLQDVESDQIKDVKERFFREAEAAGRLNHPHIVTIYDAGEEHDLAYMAMEYLVGKDLSAYCNKDSLLPVADVLRLAADVADALAYAHKNDVIHRDIKPSNLMLLNDGKIKVTDFGIARVINSSQTQTGTILGTPSYMSPEQVSGEKVKGRSDLFSLGVVCYELFSGQKPFVGDNLGALMHNIATARYAPLKRVNPNLPECCYAVVRKLLKKDFKDRYENATEVTDALRKCIKKVG